MNTKTYNTSKDQTCLLLILAYVILDYGRPFEFLQPLKAFKLPFVVSFLMFFTWLNSPYKNIGPQTKCFFLFLLIMAKNIPIATNNYWAFWTTYDMARLIFFVCLPIATFVNTSDKIYTYLNAFLLAHVILAAFGLTHKGVGIGAHLADENDFALALNMALPYAYFLSLARKNLFSKLFCLAAGFLFIVANVVSVSRGGFVGLATVLLYCWLATPGKLKGSVVALLLIASIWLYAGEEYWAEMETIQETEEGTAATRRYFWQKAWEMFLDNPVIGVGPGNYPWNIERYEVEESPFGMFSGGRVAHSLYFTLLPELGIPGAIVFCVLLYYNCKDIRSILRLTKKAEQTPANLKGKKLTEDDLEAFRKARFITLAASGSLLGYLVSGGFLSVLYYPHFWLLSALICALKYSIDGKIKELSQMDVAFADNMGELGRAYTVAVR